MTNDFSRWHQLKEKLHSAHRAPTFKEREIWWCSIGLNIGHEENGKNEHFNRPILVLRKFNKHLFWGIPLSTKIKDTPHYHKITFRGREQCVMLTHLRLYDSKRLTHKMGQLPGHEFQPVQHMVSDLALGK